MKNPLLPLPVILALGGLAAADGSLHFASGVSLDSGWYDVNKVYAPNRPKDLYMQAYTDSSGPHQVTNQTKINALFLTNDPYKNDSLHCSTAAVSNLIHSWWDRNKATAENLYGKMPENMPYKYTGSPDKYSAANSEIYKKFISNNNGGSPANVLAAQYFETEGNGYMKDYMAGDGSESSYYYKQSHLGRNITSIMENTHAALSLQLKEMLDIGPVGLNLKLTSGVGHEVTLWGYREDENGEVKSLIITNSDDNIMGLAELTLSTEKNANGHYYISSSAPVAGHYADYSYNLSTEDGSYSRDITVNNSYSAGSNGATIIGLYALYDMESDMRSVNFAPEPSGSSLALLALAAAASRRRRA